MSDGTLARYDLKQALMHVEAAARQFELFYEGAPDEKAELTRLARQAQTPIRRALRRYDTIEADKARRRGNRR